MIERFVIPFEKSNLDHIGEEPINEIEQEDGSSIFTLSPELVTQLGIQEGDSMEFLFDTETHKMEINILSAKMNHNLVFEQPKEI